MAAPTTAPALARLHAALTAQAPTIVLDREVLGDDRLPTSWSRLLGRDTLRFGSAVVSDPEPSGAFRVTGRVDLMGLAALPAELDVFAGAPAVDSVVGTVDAGDAAAVEVLLRVTDPLTSWTLSDHFPDLPGYVDVESGAAQASFLHGVPMPGVAVVLSSIDFATAAPDDPGLVARAVLAGAPVGAGLNLAATLDTTHPAWQTVRRAVPGLPGTPAVRGVVAVDDDGGLAVELRVPAGQLRWSPTPALTLTLDEIVVDSGLSKGRHRPPLFTLLAHLQAGHADLPLAVEINVGDPMVRVSGGDPAHLLTLADAVAVLGLDGTALEGLLPKGKTVTGIGSVGLASLVIEVELAPAVRVGRITAALASATPLGLLDDMITVAPTFAVDAVDPFGPPAERRLDLMIAGTWLIGGSALDVAYAPVSGEVAARLQPGGVLDLDALLGKVLANPPAIHVGLPDIELTGNVRTGAWEIRLASDDALRVPIGAGELAVREVSFAVAHDGAGTTWRFQGSVEVAGVHLLLAAQRSAGSDWRIEARGGVDPPLDLAGLLRHALERFDGPGRALPAAIPDHLATVAVREIVVHVDTAEPVLQLYVDLDLDVEVVHGLAFTHLTTSAEFDADGLVEAWIDAALELGGARIDLTTTFSAERGLELRGESADGQSVPIGHVLADLAAMTGAAGGVPAALDGLVVEKIALAYRPSTGDLSLRLDGDLPAATDVRVHVAVELTRTAGGYATHVHGELVVGGTFHFDLDLAADPTRATLAARFAGHAGTDVPLAALAGAISPALAAHVPATAAVAVDEILLIHQREPAGPRTILALALSGGLDLAGLPLVGTGLRGVLEVAFEPVVVSADHTAADITRLAPLLAGGPIELPPEGIAAGVHLETRLRAGGQTWRLGLPVTTTPTGTLAPGPAPASTPATPTATAGSMKYFAVGRSFGPVRVERVGLGLAGGTLSASVDGAIAAGPLTLELVGLTVSAALDDRIPHFSLHGLALNYRAPDVSIGGAFLHRQVSRAGVVEDVYAGRLMLATSSFALSALGEYAEHDGHPSLFGYAVLDKPIGGPTAFFVTGLAAGFGYNRELVMPEIEAVAGFPLVREATAAIPPAASLDDELTRLGDAVAPRTGATFLAVGVKFNSFKIIDSFLLLAVTLGPRVEIDVLGISRAVVPPPQAGRAVPPLAVVELAVSARFLPDEGSLLVQGRLTDASFLLSGDCRLRGGFAFAAWFGPLHEGDFVVTLGGYHPHYRPEPHFPAVPRLGFTWPVDPHLTITGDAYFALTPSALMAGGHLDASWHDGDFRAWFRAGVDLLLAWAPYHYETDLYVSIGGSYTFTFLGTHTLSISVSARLELWGPPFAGRATLDLYVTSVTVTFGPQTRPPADPLDWAGFTTSFLPPAPKVVTAAAVGGLLRTVRDATQDWSIVDPGRLRVAIQSQVPLNDPAHPRIGVGPMGVPADALRSVLTVEVRDADGNPVDAEFRATPIRRSVPAALWNGALGGGSLRPGLTDPRLVPDVEVGVELTPARPPQAPPSAPLHPADLAYDTHVHRIGARPDPVPVASPVAARPGTDALADRFTDPAAAARRQALVRSLRLGWAGSLGAAADPLPHRGLDGQLLDAPLVWTASAGRPNR